MLDAIKKALGITGDYQDGTLTEYINEVISYLNDAGVATVNITSGIVARGVADLWNYGGAEGKLSPYFIQRAIQLKTPPTHLNASVCDLPDADVVNF